MTEQPIAARPKIIGNQPASTEQQQMPAMEPVKRGPGRPAMPESLKVIHGISRLLAGLDRESKRQILETLLGIIE